jgi:CheY-like chemotaxis protein
MSAASLLTRFCDPTQPCRAKISAAFCFCNRFRSIRVDPWPIKHCVSGIGVALQIKRVLCVDQNAAPTPPTPGILVVEDDRDLLRMWVGVLGGAGYRVTGAASFEEGRRALRTSTPDVLVTDIRLGAYNGLQLIIRARADNPRLRAIVLTGFPDPVVRREAERLHAVHLEKPVDPERLLDLVAESLADPGTDWVPKPPQN